MNGARRSPYTYGPGYQWHWVWIDDGDCHRGWDGVNRVILRDGTVMPPFPEDVR